MVFFLLHIIICTVKSSKIYCEEEKVFKSQLFTSSPVYVVYFIYVHSIWVCECCVGNLFLQRRWLCVGDDEIIQIDLYGRYIQDFIYFNFMCVCVCESYVFRIYMKWINIHICIWKCTKNLQTHSGWLLYFCWRKSLFFGKNSWFMKIRNRYPKVQDEGTFLICQSLYIVSLYMSQIIYFYFLSVWCIDRYV